MALSDDGPTLRAFLTRNDARLRLDHRVTDRIILDRQVRDTISQYAQVGATVGHADRSGGLRRFIESGKKITISTVRKFPFILDEIAPAQLRDHRTTSWRRRAGSTTPTVRSTTRACTASSTSTGRCSPTAARAPCAGATPAPPTCCTGEDWPVAMWPDRRYDVEGVYSCNTFIDGDSFPCTLYTGNVAGHAEAHGVLARSADGWLTWHKHKGDGQRAASQRRLARATGTPRYGRSASCGSSSSAAR